MSDQNKSSNMFYGDNVWDNGDNISAVLFTCDDYRVHSNVVIQGRSYTWKHFKDTTGDQCDWTTPQDEEHVVLQDRNRECIRSSGITDYC